MKKKLLAGLATGLLFLSSIGIASADTIGHDVIDRSLVDNWTNFSMIDYSLQFTDAGQITSWSIFAELAGSVYLQTFRNVSGNSYEVVGENYFENVQTGVNNFAVAENDQINYQVGDYIGWTFTDPAIISFDTDAGSVDWAPGNGQFALGIGSAMTFDSSQSRIYSISAETAPVPEPATMLLFGTGLIGLIGVARRKKK